MTEPDPGNVPMPEIEPEAAMQAETSPNVLLDWPPSPLDDTDVSVEADRQTDLPEPDQTQLEAGDSAVPMPEAPSENLPAIEVPEGYAAPEFEEADSTDISLDVLFAGLSDTPAAQTEF